MLVRADPLLKKKIKQKSLGPVPILALQSWNIVTTLRWRDLLDITCESQVVTFSVKHLPNWCTACGLTIATNKCKVSIVNHTHCESYCDKRAASPMRPKIFISIWLSLVEVTQASVTYSSMVLVEHSWRSFAWTSEFGRFDKFTK